MLDDTKLKLTCPRNPANAREKFFEIKKVFFLNLIYFEIRYLTAIIFDETRITLRATHTKSTDPV
jgi:hypothetical protein